MEEPCLSVPFLLSTSSEIFLFILKAYIESMLLHVHLRDGQLGMPCLGNELPAMSPELPVSDLKGTAVRLVSPCLPMMEVCTFCHAVEPLQIRMHCLSAISKYAAISQDIVCLLIREAPAIWQNVRLEYIIQCLQ